MLQMAMRAHFSCLTGDREAGWAFEARRRAVRKLPGGSGSFDGISDGAAGGGSSTTEEVLINPTS